MVQRAYLLLYGILIICSLCIQSSLCSASEGIPVKEEAEDSSFPDISGFIVGIKGLVGFTIPNFSNLVVGSSGISPGTFSSPVEGGGGVSLGVRFGITGSDAPVPVYMRFELEYSQRIPYTLNGKTNAFTVESIGAIDPVNGYDKNTVVTGFAEEDFSLRVGSQQVMLGMFLDIDTRSSVVPYIGALFGISIFDVQIKSGAEYFIPTHEVVIPPVPPATAPTTTTYGTLNSLQGRSTEAAFLWGFALGTQIIINDYIMFDIGGRYLNNASFTVGTSGILEMKVKYDYVEAFIGISVLL